MTIEKSRTNTKPELLAPAGDLESGLVAFEAGADAVYAGLARFNARERNENFSIDELNTLVAAARQHRRKVYLTLNTLIREPELVELSAILKDVVKIAPDAVIVQDLGVLHLLRECFPSLPVHASTQMGTHNSAAVNWLADRGVERVILQRQIPLPEVREIVRNSQIEIEVFVHGALCCCLSGACMFSSWMGGWSGNRGKCKQPCRRRYFTENEGNGFFFSTNDLYGLDMLGSLEAAGVASLKIEGRLRQADYVEHVVKAYRMMLDAAPDERREILGVARAELSGALGRKWSHGYLLADEWKDVLSPTSPGVSGMLCGRVQRVSNNGFTVKIGRRVHFGDRIRIQSPQGDDGPAFTVTMMRVNGRESKTARRGDIAEFRYDRVREVSSDGMVYLIGVAAGSRKRELPPPPMDVNKITTIDFKLTIDENGFKIDVPEIGGWKKAQPLPEARNRAIEPDIVECEFRKSLIDELVAGHIDIQIQGSRFVSQRDLRHARRDFWQWLSERIDTQTPEDTDESAVLRSLRDSEAWLATPIAAAAAEQSPTTIVRLNEKTRRNPVRDALVARSIDEVDDETDEVILPDFCPEPELPRLRQKIVRLIDRGFQRWRVTSLYGLELLRPFVERLTITASFLLPVANSAGLRLLLDNGVFRATAWPELDRTALEALAERAGDRLEVFSYGRPPLLSTRVEPSVSGTINDARGNAFTIEKYKGLWRVYAEDAMELDHIPSGLSRFLDLTHANLGETRTRNFNLDRDFA